MVANSGKSFSKSCRFHITKIRPFHHDDPFILPEFPCQLIITNIYGVDIPGTMLQSTVGKTTGGCTDIDHHFIFYTHRESFQCLF